MVAINLSCALKRYRDGYYATMLILREPKQKRLQPILRAVRKNTKKWAASNNVLKDCQAFFPGAFWD